MKFFTQATFLMVSCISNQIVGMSYQQQAVEQQIVMNHPAVVALLLLTQVETPTPNMELPILFTDTQHEIVKTRRPLRMSAEHAIFFDNTQSESTPQDISSKKHIRSHYACNQTHKIHNHRKQSNANVHQPDKSGKRIFPGKNAKK